MPSSSGTAAVSGLRAMRWRGWAVGATLALSACATPTPSTGSAAWTPPIDPQVQHLLAEISPERIAARMRTLVGFGTRHTLSDTESDTRGLGAAQRWIERDWRACAAEAGGRLQISLDEHVEPAGPRVPAPTRVVNVVATLPGTDPTASQRVLVVSGHDDSRASDVMDAQADAPGANDDASGVAAVMELGCTMARHRYPATLVFLAVAGEEQGLLGAEHWAAEAHRAGMRIDAMIDNDIIGSPTDEHGVRRAHEVRLFADGGWPLLRLSAPVAASAASGARARDLSADDTALLSALHAQAVAGGGADQPADQLGRYLKTVGERQLPGFTVRLIQRRDRYLRGGDHLPFLERGDAAVRFTEPAEDFRHQHQDVRTDAHGVRIGDRMEYTDPAYVADVARINAAGLASLALAPAAPRGARIEVLDLGNATSLRWEANVEPDLAGYRVLWRAPGAPQWEHARDVGNVTRVTLDDVSKDDAVFGVQAVGRSGASSLPVFPLPLRR